jgi:hypothetical protein
MARLPMPGSDLDNWGVLLDEFLRVAHHEDGTPRGTYEIINVKDFGAIGDGNADDTAALQNAINAAAGKVLLIDRPLRIAAPASIVNTSNAHLIFVGLGKLITDFGSLSAVRIMSPGSGYTSVPTVRVVDGGGSGAAISIALGGQRCSVSAPGSGYGFRDKVEVNSGTASEKMRLEITGRNSAGNALTARVIQHGKYTVLPPNPVSVTTIEGNGSGAIFNITWQVTDASVTAAGTQYVTEPAIALSGPAAESAELRAIGSLLTLQGVVEAPPIKIFDGYGGTGNFSDKTPTLYPQWWGAAAGGADCRAGLQKCFDSAFQKMVRIPAGKYSIGGYVIPPSICTIVGDGRNSTILQPSVATDVFRINAGFDLFIESVGVADPNNVQALGNTAFFFDNRLNSVQRVFIRDVLITGTRAFANSAFEAFPVFGIKISDISAYIKGAFCEFFYTTGMELTNCLSEHINLPQDHSVLRDFWFYGNDADLGGGLVMTDCISRVPSHFGIVLEGPGNGHCWERFLQAWLRNCSTDNSGETGVLVRRGEQIHIENGYYALAHNNSAVIAADTDVRDLTVNNVTIAAGSYCKLLLTAIDGALISNNFIAEGDSAGILIDGTVGAPFNVCRNVVITGNLIKGNREGVRMQGNVDRVNIAGNSWYSNQTPLYNAASGTDIVNTGNM